ITDKSMHVVCRLKNGNVQYLYKGRLYTLAELYRKVGKQFEKDKKTGLMPARITVRLQGSDEDAVIVFSKGYEEPEDNTVKSKKKKKTQMGCLSFYRYRPAFFYYYMSFGASTD
ncbi:MAG: hypothetical protein GY749_25135, partial [Desulfobacteraceae bacterium]|nr:hypothetical protein [Desulfobacteraceae bacterium]